MHTHDHQHDEHEHHHPHDPGRRRDPEFRGGRGPRGGAMSPDDDPRGRRGRPGRPGRGRGGRPPFGGEFFGRGGRANRGDVRAAILTLLAEQPMHGYQIIGELSERTGGIWKLSPGSVYPTLQHLQDEGLVQGDQSEGKNVFSLTDAGRAAVAERAGQPAPWEEVGAGVDGAVVELHDLLHQLIAAFRQIVEAGTPSQVGAAKAVLTETRRSLYRILAEDA
jgi:DNA-binding PadR family transcriptional regulator